MGILDAFLETVNFLSDSKEMATDHMTIAQLDRKNMKEKSDIGAYMEYLMEKETDPVIKKKLEWRLGSGVYEYEDLYENK